MEESLRRIEAGKGESGEIDEHEAVPRHNEIGDAIASDICNRLGIPTSNRPGVGRFAML